MSTPRRSRTSLSPVASLGVASPSNPVRGSQRQTRSVSRTRHTTPRARSVESHHSQGHHHHRSADEIALEEAEELVGTPERGTPRELRHRRLVEAKEAAESLHKAEEKVGRVLFENDDGRAGDTIDEEEEEKEEVVAMDEEDEMFQVEQRTPSARRTYGANGPNRSNSSPPSPVGSDGSHTLVSRPTGHIVDHADDQSDAAVPEGRSATYSTDLGSEVLPATGVQEGRETGDETSGVSSDSSSSGSDSDHDTGDTTGESDSETDSDEEQAELEKLLSTAKLAAERRANAKFDTQSNVFGEDQDGMLSVRVTDETRRLAPIPDISVGKLPQTPLSFASDGRARAQKVAPAVQMEAGPSKPHSHKARGNVLQPDNLPYERKLSKREQAAMKKPTTSELWAAMPGVRADALPQMRKDYQALALAASLDPKRHMKGGTKTNKVPESFAIGTLVDQPRHLQDTTVSSSARYRPGDVVKSLTRDEEVGNYAKRKYGDLQWNRMENGRGKGWKKKSK